MDKVVNGVHVSTPFTGEMSLDCRSNKYIISVVIQSIDSFHQNPVINDNKESVKRLKDASGPGHSEYYVPTPFSSEANLDRSNESPGFKNNEEDDNNKDTLSTRLNDSLPDSIDEVNFLSGYFSRSIRDTLVTRGYLLQSFLEGQRIYFDNKKPVVNKEDEEKETYHTEENVLNRVHVFTPFTREMPSDGRNNKYTVSVVI